MRLLFLLSFFCLSFCLQAKIVTSIMPLQSLACMLLDGITTPDVLLNGHESAHTYTLKPSDVEKIKTADLIIWLGPSYEGFLTKAILTSQKPDLRLLSLDLNLLPLRECHHGHHHDDQHDHDHLKDSLYHYDPHVWLDPRYCQKLLKAMHGAFVKIFPHDKKYLDENLKSALFDMDQLYKELKQVFLPLKHKPFIVYHDGYQYLEKAFHLKGMPMLMNPDVPMTLSEHVKLQATLKKHLPSCVFLESQFPIKTLETFIQRYSLKTAVLDPIGIGLGGKEGYGILMTTLANTMKKCLL